MEDQHENENNEQDQKINVFETIIQQELGSIGVALGPFFSQQLRETQTIEISGNNTLKYRFTDEDFSILISALVKSEINIQCLSFRHHRLTSKSIETLATLWSVVPLYQIDLEGNEIDTNIHLLY